MILSDPFVGLDRKETQIVVSALKAERNEGRGIVVSFGNASTELLSLFNELIVLTEEGIAY